MKEFNRKSHFWMKPLKAHLMCVDGIKVRGEIIVAFISRSCCCRSSSLNVVGFWITVETNHQMISLFHYKFSLLPPFIHDHRETELGEFLVFPFLFEFNCSRNFSPFLIPRLSLFCMAAMAVLSGVCVFTCFFSLSKSKRIPAFYTHGISP